MSKGVQLWPGDSMRAFYRRHIARETALDAAAVERLVEALTKATNRMLVWEMPEEAKAVPAVAPAAAAAPPSGKAEKKAPDKGKTHKGAGPIAEGKTGKAEQPSPAAAPEPEKPFDPYAFSAMVVLAKQGKDALAKRLADIKTVENLKKFADAQHLGFDRTLTKIEDVRKALLAAAEQRVADRRAAAS